MRIYGAALPLYAMTRGTRPACRGDSGRMRLVERQRFEMLRVELGSRLVV
jgi:hypothetical protein